MCHGVMTSEVKQSSREVSSNKRYVDKEHQSSSSTIIVVVVVVVVVDYQTRNYGISTSFYIQVRLKKNSEVLEYSEVRIGELCYGRLSWIEVTLP